MNMNSPTNPMRRRTFLWWNACLLGAAWGARSASAQDQPQEHPLVPAIQLLKQSYEVVQKVQDYEATLIKREMVNGKLLHQRIRLRIREAPFSVYMFFEDPNPGRQVLFVNGQYNNELLVRDASGITALAGTMNLAIDSPQVMAENRHVITDMGMKRMLELLAVQWQEESKYGECNVKFYPGAKMGNAECEVIECSHPRPRRQFPYHMTRVFLEKQSRLPIRVENYGFPPEPNQQAPLLEEYTYVNVKTNVGLKDADFDRRNPNYSFQ
ncbi:DUF1571 domain-containing protein [Planctomicrobium sp. SH668]|uniref:DUF1571 domain-containing protein n=1 Tax=Planctomicrobium sp. SH668 TaxID=3448126 RepID=UPI003F5B4425